MSYCVARAWRLGKRNQLSSYVVPNMRIICVRLPVLSISQARCYFLHLFCCVLVCSWRIPPKLWLHFRAEENSVCFFLCPCNEKAEIRMLGSHLEVQREALPIYPVCE